MASFTGRMFLRGESVPWAHYPSAPTGGRVSGPFSLTNPVHWEGGAFARHQPIAPFKLAFEGDTIATYFDDYYNRIWLNPVAVDFGPLTATSFRRVYIWNAHIKKVTLESFTLTGDAGVAVEGIDLPKKFNALGGDYFEVWASIDGDPDLLATVALAFTPVEGVSLQIFGIRSRLWSFPPNWNEPFEVSLEYLSEIITSASGKEQRRAVRQTPRKDFSFATLVNETKFRAFLRHMAAWQGRSTIMPEYSRWTSLREPAAEGAQSVVVDAIPNWLTPNRLIVLSFGDEWLVRTIDTVVGNVLTFKSTIMGAWPAGTKLYSAVSGRLSTQIDGTQHTNQTATINVRFSSDPGVEEWPDVNTPLVTHNGREVFLAKPNWGRSPTPEFRSFLQQVDYGFGRIDNFLHVTFNDRYQKAEYIGFDWQGVEALMDLFRRNYGQVGEFYMPTYTEDLRIKVASPATTSNLRIAGTDTAADYAAGTVFRDLIVFFVDGSYLMRHVQSIYEVHDADGDDTAIQVTEPWPLDIDPVNVAQICWMPLWRHASDAMTVQWVTDQAAQIAMTIKTIEYADGE